MNQLEKAKWLSEFYAQVAEGGQMQARPPELPKGWCDQSCGPHMKSSPSDWRIKPEPREWWVRVNDSGLAEDVLNEPPHTNHAVSFKWIKVREVVE